MRELLKPRIFLFLLVLLAIPAASFAQFAVSVRIGPPALPVYTQPICPGDGYLWTPGYWGYGAAGYYWVPGVWVMPPRVGVLWTPGYWGFEGGLYGWHAGYWGPHVGFYGGINYGYGYGGVGFVGGHWGGGRFMYNTAVLNVGAGVHNTFVDRTVINRTTVVNRVSFNGEGGIKGRPNEREQAAEHENHFQPTSNQLSHEHAAGQDHNQLASVNHGRPSTMAMSSVNARRDNQQQRIANGIRSGQMSPSEASKTEAHEQNINHQIAVDRQANGGKLTPTEKKSINQKQNSASKQIYNDNHNEKKAPR
jgi:WXXGXW repeat (2 copies)